MNMTVRLIKPRKGLVITYQANLLTRDTTSIFVHARWERELLDLGYVTFAPGDNLYEYFFSDRWYNIYELHSTTGTLKGWYCNIARPALFGETTIESEDLELDVFVSPDCQTFLVLDEDEYTARGLEKSDPGAHRQVLVALEELRSLVEQGKEPFCREKEGKKSLWEE